MPISMHHLVRTESEQLLTGMLNVLDHAEGLVRDGKAGETELMASKLAPDMFSLSMQVWRAADHGRAAARLAGRETPPFTDMGELSLDDARARIEETMALVKSVTEDELEGAEDKTIEIIARGEPTRFRGEDYLLRIAIPQIAFHVTTAYDIVRHAGAELGKRHYLCDAFDYTLD